MSNQLIINTNLPSIDLPQNVINTVKQQYADAAASMASSGLPRLSFSGKAFNISFGGDSLELPERVLDVHIVAINPKFFYTFYEKPYTGTAADKEGRIMARYPLPTDEIDFKPTAEWAQRAYKQRCVVMLANDPEHKLYVADFGYNSVRKVGNPQLGLLNLSQLVTQFDYLSRNNPQLLPFMLTVQLSFTRQSVPEIQFSLYDQRQQGNFNARFADQAAITAMVEALSSGEVDNMLNIEYESVVTQAPVQQAPVQQAPVQQAPVQQAPVQQAQGGLDEMVDL